MAVRGERVALVQAGLPPITGDADADGLAINADGHPFTSAKFASAPFWWARGPNRQYSALSCDTLNRQTDA
jgi:hypothetical protein